VRRLLAAPDLRVAQALAAEWNAQGEEIDPAAMPLTRLANAIIDAVADQPDAVRNEIVKYLHSDLVFYRADSPESLIARQAELWDPFVNWARDVLESTSVLLKRLENKDLALEPTQKVPIMRGAEAPKGAHPAAKSGASKPGTAADPDASKPAASKTAARHPALQPSRGNNRSGGFDPYNSR